MELKRENYYPHNYSNPKVFEWVLENHVPTEEIRGTAGFEDKCVVSEKYSETGSSNGYFIEDENGNEVRYFDYADNYEWEEVVAAVPGLTEVNR